MKPKIEKMFSFNHLFDQLNGRRFPYLKPKIGKGFRLNHHIERNYAMNEDETNEGG